MFHDDSGACNRICKGHASRDGFEIMVFDFQSDRDSLSFVFCQEFLDPQGKPFKNSDHHGFVIDILLQGYFLTNGFLYPFRPNRPVIISVCDIMKIATGFSKKGYQSRFIDFLEIESVRKTIVGRLPFGLQKRVELGRALAAEPDILLLDEPMAGMNLEEKEDMCRFILDVNEELGTTIVLIEHDMSVVMDISDRVIVLDYGRKISEGVPDAVRNDQKVIDAYLGVSH